MFYFHADNDYIILLPSLAFSFRGEFWIEIDWLNFNFGWRSGNEVQKPDLTYEEVEQIIKDLPFNNSRIMDAISVIAAYKEKNNVR